MRAVILYHSEDNTYTKISHNISDEEADNEVQMLRKGMMPAFYIQQRKRHSKMDIDECTECDHDIREITKTGQGTAMRNGRLAGNKRKYTIMRENTGDEEL